MKKIKKIKINNKNILILNGIVFKSISKKYKLLKICYSIIDKGTKILMEKIIKILMKDFIIIDKLSKKDNKIQIISIKKNKKSSI